ncbi:SHOCT domain-containing protein [Streptomyces bikiniensis]|uniref:SHOCT domain-containing protein n=1 Tax=Streptomyces bikiniensis TaxID=1896 RepID=A0ABW8CZM4_STRBI
MPAHVIARGRGTSRRAIKQAKDSDAAFQDHIRKAAGTQGVGAQGVGAQGVGAQGVGASATDEPARLAELKDRGAITPEGFEKAKARAMS